ncbi:TIGR04282 family arsenosugar biosynthesis glycosyltransferase [Amycolatopsis anabasis]|uniref:TIGR04282 family arsenosugar biosynthesis glycosyltransferase n=1 Tax=Amycolatopsis anabasis TaxID=1840409 RepID=UPI00131C033C|nr:DUF2064 domain-containing protein [Amycolatopsis anabasis]
MNPFCLLVVAKAPVPGFAKTRLCPPATATEAAEIAAASLLDTLDAVAATPGALPVVAVTGDLGAAAGGDEIRRALRAATVLAQRGRDFGERLANAHADTAARHPGRAVVQIGMDTPQVTAELLADAAERLAHASSGAVLGPAEDGGWWALGLRDPRRARVLAEIPMSRPDTGELTRGAIGSSGTLRTLSDVDTMADARRVAELAPHGRFAAAVARIREAETAR